MSGGVFKIGANDLTRNEFIAYVAPELSKKGIAINQYAVKKDEGNILVSARGTWQTGAGEDCTDSLDMLIDAALRDAARKIIEVHKAHFKGDSAELGRIQPKIGNNKVYCDNITKILYHGTDRVRDEQVEKVLAESSTKYEILGDFQDMTEADIYFRKLLEQ